MAKVKKERPPTQPWKVVVLLVGLGAIVIGILAFKYGLAPGGPIMSVMMAGTNANEEQLNQLEPAMAELQSTPRVVADVAGLVLTMGGFIAVKVGMSPPKPKSIEEQVRDEVAKRLGTTGLDEAVQVNLLAASSVPNAAPVAPPNMPVQSAVVQATTPSGATSSMPARSGTHCSTCGRTLLAGRFCRVCDK